jgi:ribose 1,5-bisphosphokinase PhnN
MINGEWWKLEVGGWKFPDAEVVSEEVAEALEALSNCSRSALKERRTKYYLLHLKFEIKHLTF